MYNNGMMRRNEYNDIATIVQGVINPLTTEMQALKSEVRGLAIDRVTRSDLEKLRTEIVGSFVPRDSYEPKHAALIERDTQLEALVREIRKDQEADNQRLEAMIREQGKAHLDEKDRNWIRGSQILSGIAIGLTILSLIMQHVHFN